MLKTQFGVPQKIGLIPAIHRFPRIGHFRRKDGFLVQKCLPVLAAFVAKMDSWLESASHLSAYRQEQGFAIARLPLQASGNDHKPQRHDSGCHRQEPSKALVNTVMTDGFVGLGLAMAIPVVKP